MPNYCDTCLNLHKPNVCERCIDNPRFGGLVSHYIDFLERCPIKEEGCGDDPGFILRFFPNKYKELFGDIRPDEAVEHKNSKCVNCEYRKR